MLEKRSTKKYTQQEFIDKAKSIHGDKYDYSKVVYVNNKTRITLICPKHGEFTIRPFNHIVSGDGCSACRYEAKYDLKYYIDKLLAKYPNLNISKNQDLTEKVKRRELGNILLSCPMHGDYKVKLKWLIDNTGKTDRGNIALKCPKCYKKELEKKREDKLEEAREALRKSRDIEKEVYDKFGNKYELITKDYKSPTMKLTLKCEKHGYFLINLLKLEESEGCPNCVADERFNEFLIKAKEIHGDAYEYKKGGFRGKLTDLVHLVCPKHGVQPMRAQTILSGTGCKQCYLERDGSRFVKYSNDSVLERIKAIHGDTYDYSLFKYGGSEVKVKLICKHHGVFEITPHSLLKGHGCYQCGRESHTTKTRYTLEEAARKGNLIHANKYKYLSLDYIPIKTDHGVKNVGFIKYICPDCNRINKQKLASHLSGYGCKKCYESKGERRIEAFLLKHNIKHQREACIKNTKYRIDFYLTDLKIGVEYNGIQHYKDYSLYSRDTGSAYIRKNDVAKILWFEKYGSTIITIPYTVKNIEEYLENELRQYFKYYKDGYVFRTYYELAKFNKFNKENFADNFSNYRISNLKSFPFTAKSVNEFPLIAGTPLELDNTKDG